MSEGDYTEEENMDCMENENGVISNEPHLTRNPLLNYLVVVRLFEYFNLEEIKNRRFVCQEWNCAAQELLRKRSKIIFTNTKKDIPKFWNTFYASHSKHPVTHFEFKQDFFVREALSIFKIYGPFIKILNLEQCNVKFQNPDGTILPCRRVDISKWISKCINLTELNMSCLLGTKQCIPMRHLISVKKLTLFNCDVLLEKDVKISPVEIILTQVKFFVKYSERLPEIVLNNAFDFQKTDFVMINQIGATPSILDMGQGVAKIGGMYLLGVRIINLENSQWIINNLKPDRLSILNQISMNIKRLEIYNISSFLCHSLGTETIDFSMFPATLENLHFSMEAKTKYISSTTVNLPNLKHLTVNMCAHVNASPISHFTNCPNINTVSLTSNSPQIILDASLLPRNFKKLDINNNITIANRPNNVGEKFCVNILVFRVRSLSALRACVNVLKNIKPDILCLFFGGRECSWDIIVQFVQEHIQLKTIFVNSFVSPLKGYPRNFNPTDGRPEFSVFEDKVCRAITLQEFTRAIII